jgi:radical SAM superfamily enzyme YgiQ (UPF0313 family)
MRKGATVDQARRAMDLCRKTGMKSSIYLLVGLPWETEETFRETSNLAVELNPDFLEIFYPYPFQDRTIRLRSRRLLEDDPFPKSLFETLVQDENFSIEERSHMRRRL